MTQTLIENETDVQQRNQQYYDKYGSYYEDYHAYFRNKHLLKQWRNNLHCCQKALPPKEHYYALDFGCGTGLLTLMLLDMGFYVTAVDISQQMLTNLQAKVAQRSEDQQKRLKVIHGGLEQLETLERDHFDFVGESSVMHHLHHYVTFMELAYPLLSPGGVLYIGREPLHLDEQHHNIKLCLPWNMFIVRLNRWLDKHHSKGKFKEVFAPDIMPSHGQGGVSMSAFQQKASELNMIQLFQKVYNWHRTPQAFWLDNLLPRPLRWERFWGTFFDLAMQK